MKKQVTLITWAGLPEGAESERLLRPFLAASGVEAQLADWRDTAVDFSAFDLVVLRSCWNYHLHAKEFTEWLVCTATRAPILNKPDTVLWNSNKFYLRQLEEMGIQIVPTCFVSGGEQINQRQREQIDSWKKIVVKPAISASAYQTRVFERENRPAPEKLVELVDGNDFLVQ